MSVIACKRTDHGWEIGSDRAICCGEGSMIRTTTELCDRQNVNQSKVIALAPGVLAGFCGVAIENIFRVFYLGKYGTLSGLANAGHDELSMVAIDYVKYLNCLPEPYREFALLLINNLGAWEICGPLVDQVSQYTAIGSGSQLAMAVMDTGADLFSALSIACKRDAFCGGGVEVIRMCDQPTADIQTAESGGLT